MYYLANKLGDRIPEGIKKFSMNILNDYIKRAKEMDLQLTEKELYDRIIDN